MHQTKLDQLTAKVKAVNLAHAYANDFYPILREFFAPFVGQKILKADGELLAKRAMNIPAFPAVTGRQGQDQYATIRVYRNRCNYSLYWTVNVCQPLPSMGCTYYDATVTIGELCGDTLKELAPQENLSLRTDYTTSEILAKIEDYEAKRKVMEEARSELYLFSEYTR